MSPIRYIPVFILNKNGFNKFNETDRPVNIKLAVSEGCVYFRGQMPMGANSAKSTFFI